MSRISDKLKNGADHRWPGSGEHFVAIHEFMRQGGRAKGLDSAIRINFFLTMGGDRTNNLAIMHSSIEARKPTRPGKRMALYDAAIIAILALKDLHAMDMQAAAT